MRAALCSTAMAVPKGGAHPDPVEVVQPHRILVVSLREEHGVAQRIGTRGPALQNQCHQKVGVTFNLRAESGFTVVGHSGDHDVPPGGPP